jgi:hypothetical protein
MPLVILYGSNEQISSGKGEVAITAAQAAARLGVSASRIRQMVLAERLQPLTERLHGADLFLERDVEMLKAVREGVLREVAR